MSRLDYITIKGFKSIASVERLDLGAVNVVIGPNGSGKSNLIGIFSFLHALREARLQDYVVKAGGADRVLHFGSKVTKDVFVQISFDGGQNQYEINLQPTSADELVPHGERVAFWNKQYPKPDWNELSPNGKESGISGVSQSRIAGNVRNHLDGWRLYHVHDTSSSSPMKKTADVDDNRFLRPDGSNLAAFLYFLRVKHESAYALIRKTIQLAAPFFDDFQLEPQRLNPNKIQLEWRHKGSDAYFDVSSLSDGTLRFISLSTLFLQPERYRPSVIVVDEPELGLHPYAIQILASLVKQAAVSTQVILSTQSSLFLDHFEPSDVLVANRVREATEFSRLDADELAVWLEDYSLGQLWEKNILGGRPGQEAKP
jgi:predicted ATPase